jgi:thiosulfate dehydrogenase
MSRGVLMVAVALGVACGPVPAKDAGAQLFEDARLSASDANAFACATCHAIDEPGERIYPGLSLKDAAARARFWGGASTSLLDATNACVTFFMRGQPLAKDEPKSRALYELLVSKASQRPLASGPALPLTIVENVTTVARGDPARGAAVWDAACRACHGAPHTGDGRLTELASIVPEASVAFAEELAGQFPVDLIVIEKVRHGPFFGVGGTMPPFPVEQLSDEDLGALIAFLGL